MDALIARSLKSLPSEDLVTKVASDPQIRRQTEAINAAYANADVVQRIRWSYMVLEQEKKRRSDYVVPDKFRFLRNAVSHPELDRKPNTAYFQQHLGVNYPDVKNERHIEFLKKEGQALFKEAIRIVDSVMESQRFWA